MATTRLGGARTSTDASSSKGLDDARVSSRDLDNASQKSIDYVPPVVARDEPSSGNALHLEGAPTEYRTYKRRWFGVLGLALINCIAAMNWVLFTTISTQTANFFHVSLTKVNWLSNIVCVMYLIVSWFIPPLIERFSIAFVAYMSAFLLVLGGWLRYWAGSIAWPSEEYHASAYALVFLGSVCVGAAQASIQIVGPAFSETWFSPRGRTSITALFAIANPFGGAVADIMAPAIVSLDTTAGDQPLTLLLIMAITTTAGMAFVFGVLSRPPTPPSYAAATKKESIIDASRILVGMRPRERAFKDGARRTRGYIDSRARLDFAILCAVFSALVGFFGSYSTLINQIYGPHGYSSDATGFFGAASILSGILAAAISSPIFDRYLTRHFAIVAKFLTPIIGIAYFALIWAVKPNDYGGIYFLNVITGVCSFILLPAGLELGAEVTTTAMTPASSSAILYLCANGMSVVFILIMNALRDGPDASPPYSMKRALIFQGVVALVISLTIFGLRGEQGRRRRDEEAAKSGTAATSS